jgi:hypothetical protein
MKVAPDENKTQNNPFEGGFLPRKKSPYRFCREIYQG